MKKPITLGTVLEAKKKLENLPKMENSQRVITTREAVQILKKQITELRGKGYSLMQIAEELSKQGIEVKESTLRLYRKGGISSKQPDSRDRAEPQSTRVA